MFGGFDRERFMRSIGYNLPIRTFMINWVQGYRWLFKQQMQSLRMIFGSFVIYSMAIIFVLVFDPASKVIMALAFFGSAHLLTFGYAELDDLVSITITFGYLWCRLINRLMLGALKLIVVAAVATLCFVAFA